VKDQSHLEQLFAYVHLNPVAAGIVNDPADYENSGHLEIIGGRPPRLVDTRVALAIFDADYEKARDRYLRLLKNHAEVRWIRQGVRKLPWWKTVHQIVTEGEAPYEARLFDGADLPLTGQDLDIAEIVARFEKRRALVQGCLASRRQTSSLTRERQLLTLYLVRCSSIQRCEIARCLGRNQSTVSRWLNRAVELNVSDSEFREQLSYIEATLQVQE
jgi:hypothetical protein